MLDTQTTNHIHGADLELYLRGRLESECTSSVECHLLECIICRQHLFECLGQRLAFHPIRETTSEKAHERSEPRFNSQGEATLLEIHPLSLDRQNIKIVNVSKNGLGILSPKAIVPGTIVQLRIKDTVELGNVRYCAVSGNKEFQIGLRTI